MASAGPFWEERGSPQPCYCTNAASPTLYHCRKFEFNPKDGIDNPALSLAEDTGKYPRLCQHGFWQLGITGVLGSLTPGSCGV